MSNVLEIGGVKTTELVKKLGTPLVVYDEGALEKRLALFKNSFVHPDFETQIIYASKAFSCTEMLKLVKNAGCGLDSVSGGELALAQHIGFPMEEVVFHGNNKTPAEIRQAIKAGVGYIIIDGIMEADEIIKASNELDTDIAVLIRINPGISADTHKYIITADIDSKFGISIYEFDTVIALIEKIKASKHVKFDGLHIHIGSQIFGTSPFIAGVETIAKYIAKVEKAGHPVRVLDLGGGFAAAYVETDKPEPLNEVCEKILESCAVCKRLLELSYEKVMIEPGRSMVAEAGTSLYTVGYNKTTANKKYVFVDGGMSDNIRPALYGALYRCVLANKTDAECVENVTIAGKCCESGDILIENTPLPEAKPGDILAMFTTGAYGYSMASNYNKLGLPAVCFVKDGRARLVIKRQSFEDMWALDTDIEL